MDNKYLDFKIEQEYEKEIVVKNDYSHRQKVNTTVTRSVNATTPIYVDIEHTLRVIRYEYNEFLKRAKTNDNSRTAFNLNVYVGIYEKAWLFRIGVYKSYDSVTVYYKPNHQTEQETRNPTTPDTVESIIIDVKYALTDMLNFAKNYDKD